MKAPFIESSLGEARLMSVGFASPKEFGTFCKSFQERVHG